MVQAKECCCGCTLRTGSLILLWTLLMIEAFQVLYYLSILLYYNPYRRENLTVLYMHWYYLLITSIIGMTVSLLGIIGIQKNIAKYLNPSFYYFLYETFHIFFITVLLIFASDSWLFQIFSFDAVFSWITHTSHGEVYFVAVIGSCFFIALIGYFALIIRSCRDTMTRNKANFDDPQVPDRMNVGYRVA